MTLDFAVPQSGTGARRGRRAMPGVWGTGNKESRRVRAPQPVAGRRRSARIGFVAAPRRRRAPARLRVAAPRIGITGRRSDACRAFRRSRAKLGMLAQNVNLFLRGREDRGDHLQRGVRL